MNVPKQRRATERMDLALSHLVVLLDDLFNGDPTVTRTKADEVMDEAHAALGDIKEIAGSL
jgi:hypothetical protein